MNKNTDLEITAEKLITFCPTPNGDGFRLYPGATTLYMRCTSC